MKRLSRPIGVIFIGVLLLTGCASLSANLNSPMKSSIQGKRIAVFPFKEPYYGGRQLVGIGTPFAEIFVSKLQSKGISSKLVTTAEFRSIDTIDADKACKYASENSYDYVIIGTVTEWIDGATQWSGTVDVAALSINIYNVKECNIEGSVSGRQTGTWFTFVNEPTTRFYEPLSETIVSKIINN